MNTKIIIFIIIVALLSGCIDLKKETNITDTIGSSIKDINDAIVTQIPKDSNCIESVKYRMDGHISKSLVGAVYTIDEEIIYNDNIDVKKYRNNYRIGGNDGKDYPMLYSPFTVIRVTVNYDEPIDYFGIPIYKLSDVYVCNFKGDII